MRYVRKNKGIFYNKDIMVSIKDCTRNVVIYFHEKNIITFEGLVTPENEIIFYKASEDYDNFSKVITAEGLDKVFAEDQYTNNLRNILQNTQSFDVFQNNCYVNINDNLKTFNIIKNLLIDIFNDYFNLHYEKLNSEEKSEYYTELYNGLLAKEYAIYCPYPTSKDVTLFLPRKIKTQLLLYCNESSITEKNYHPKLIPILYFLKTSKQIGDHTISYSYEPISGLSSYDPYGLRDYLHGYSFGRQAYRY